MFDLASIYTWILLILLGFNIGILSGFFGVGGCFILTPFAVGTSLVTIVISSIFSVFSGWKSHCSSLSIIWYRQLVRG